MYKKNKNHQIAFTDFNQPLGLQMNPDNRWVKKAATIPWNEIEDKYAGLFPSNTGNVAKPLRMALGSLLIQQQYRYADEELVEQIRENPYYQYFIGLPGYVDEIPFVPSLLVEFRKRLSTDIMVEINEMIIAYNLPDDSDDNDDNNGNSGMDENAEIVEGYDTSKNSGTLIIDATCAPQNIKYPQDINLLNEAREKLEKLIKKICKEQNWYVPRTYCKNARKDFLRLAKCRKRPAEKVRTAIKIVSISQPYIRPIVRGKAKAPTEFGAKLDLSVDEHGMARLEKLSFDAYNESDVLKTALENYRERTGHYPERMLADQIYRNRDNINFCKKWHIRLSGKALGRPKKAPAVDKKTEYQDNVDRIEVERKFSLAKRKFGLGLIRTKLEDTTKSSILLAIIAMNVDRLSSLLIRWILWVLFGKLKAVSC